VKRCLTSLLPLVLLLLAACGAEPTGGPPLDDSVPGSGGTNAAVHLDAPYVVMLSLDGFRWDYIDLFDTPNLDRIVETGVRADGGMVPVFPVKTFPNHYSIATGMYAENHQLVGNTFCVPEWDACYAIGDRDAVEDGRFYGGQPIWVTAEKQDMVTASYFWVGTEAPVQGIQPSTWYPFDGDVKYEQRVDSVLTWLARPPQTRPHLVTFYFEETDTVGHGFPPDSPQMRAAVARVDDMVGRFLDGLEGLGHGDEVNGVVVSDHGVGAFTAEQTYFVGDLVELGDDVNMVGSGPHSILYVDGDDERIRSLRDELAAAMPRVGVYLRAEMPERFHYANGGDRAGDIVLVPEFGWSVLAGSSAEWEARSGYTHGWERETPQMQALFIAMGPDIVAGATVPPFDNVHIYPIVAEILGLTPYSEIDGRLQVLQGILR